MVVETGGEDLRLVFQPAERAGVDDAIAISLEIVTIRVGCFGITAAPALFNREPQVRKSAKLHSLLRRGQLAESSDRSAADGATLCS